MGPKPSPKPPLDVVGAPINAARRRSPPDESIVDWSKYRQLGPSCDMDDNGDPKPPKIVKR